MKNRIVLISGVIAALVLILFLAYPYLKNSQSFLAVVAIFVTFAVLALAIPANLFSGLRNWNPSIGQFVTYPLRNSSD
ncbi:hypothetical protein [Candidatus Regiella insecticola]|uniref:hypothetical protein n=1 Tax=Candidatus Regiella insecticola TaxID=138073 RepID=UPI000587A6E7